MAHAPSKSGVWSWITTVDHKRIGILYGTTAVIFFLVGGFEALLIRLQLAEAEATLIGSGLFSQLFTMHALTMIFLAIMPLGACFFNFIVPLQIGARDVAFPRLNALSYWLFLFGALLLNSSFIFGGAPDAGWFSYANLTANEYSPSNAIDFFSLGMLVLGISSLAAALNFIITIFNLRAPGMTLMRMPVFTWMTLVVSFLLVFALPILTVGLVQLLFWREFGMPFFSAEMGGDPLLWQHIFWLFGHPEVYILILPAMGIVSEILPTFSRKPLFGYSTVVFAGVAIGFMGFTVWAHHMFTVGLGSIALAAFSASTMLIAVPTGIKIFNWIATIWGGAVNLKTPMMFALGFVALFVIGGLSGVMHASPPVDQQQQDTYFVVAHLHYVLFGGSIMGLMGGIYYWFPKVTGRLLSEKLGQWHFWLMFIGMNVTFGPMHLVGIDGMPRRIYTYDESMGWEFLNQLETVGAFIIAFSVVIFLVNFFKSVKLRRGGRGRPLGRPYAGVGDPVAASGVQLRAHSGGPQQRTVLGPEASRVEARCTGDRGRRIGRGRGVHPHAEPVLLAHRRGLRDGAVRWNGHRSSRIGLNRRGHRLAGRLRMGLRAGRARRAPLEGKS